MKRVVSAENSKQRLRSSRREIAGVFGSCGFAHCRRFLARV
jgi:hypothetical protein